MDQTAAQELKKERDKKEGDHAARSVGPKSAASGVGPAPFWFEYLLLDYIGGFR